MEVFGSMVPVFTILLCLQLGQDCRLTSDSFQVEVFWVMTLCSVVAGYQHFTDPCCPHFTLKM